LFSPVISGFGGSAPGPCWGNSVLQQSVKPQGKGRKEGKGEKERRREKEGSPDKTAENRNF